MQTIVFSVHVYLDVLAAEAVRKELYSGKISDGGPTRQELKRISQPAQ